MNLAATPPAAVAARRRLVSADIVIRPIDFERDRTALKSFLAERDQNRLDHSEPAVRDGDCFVFVAADDGTAVGWAVVHLNFREDQDWDPPDEDTRAFQSGDSAYLENIEVTAGQRSRGVGSRLLQATEDEARRRGKRTLWLHSSENNAMAHRVFERAGWVHERTVTPPWRPNSRTRVYKKELKD